jgi:hypothetical protein
VINDQAVPQTQTTGHDVFQCRIRFEQNLLSIGNLRRSAKAKKSMRRYAEFRPADNTITARWQKRERVSDSLFRVSGEAPRCHPFGRLLRT